MKSTEALFSNLTQPDIDWLLSGGQRRVEQTEYLIEAGKPVDAFYVVLEGVFGVFKDSERNEPLSLLGPGEIVGDMSFLEGIPPTEFVAATETSTVLELSRTRCESKFSEDPAFAIRFYQGVAKSLSQRLRRMNRRMAAHNAPDLIENSANSRLMEEIADLKSLLLQASTAANRNFNDVPADLADSIVNRLLYLFGRLNEVIGDEVVENELVKDQVGLQAQKEFLPYLLLSKTAERFYSKPRGYAGDFQTIEIIYDNNPEGTGPLGRLIDKAFLDSPPSAAVRNRRPLLAQEIQKLIASNNGQTARITSLACGPAEEIFDVFQSLEDKSKVKATLLDFDLQALAFVSERRTRMKLSREIDLVDENLIYLALGRTKTDLTNQDLIYSIGLIDYFNDELVIKLLNLIHRMLRPGGKTILGNFHPRNSAKAFMDYILEWRLIHRTEEDMDRLFSESAFDRPCTNIRFEAQGINLFAECVKE